jgi:broad specificity phosphatase PhoE
MKFKNKYFLMRHGQAISNVKRLCSCRPEKFKNPLTEFGQEMTRESAEKLKEKLDEQGQTIDLIFCSPLQRTKETAKIAGKILNNNLKIKVDVRLREVGFGIFNGKNLQLMWKNFEKEEDRIKGRPPRGESYEEILKRMMAAVKDIEKKYKDRNVMLISHEGPLFLLQGKFEGLSIEQTIKKYTLEKRIHKGEIRKIN